MRLNDTTRTYFEKMANISPPAKAAHYKGLLNPQTSEAAQRYLLENEPQSYSMLRTSVYHMFKAGVGRQCDPVRGGATLDIRALPDENITGFYAEMARIINDPAVKIVPLPATRPPSPVSRMDTEMYQVLERVSKEMYPTSRSYRRCRRWRATRPGFAPRGQQSNGIGPAGTLGPLELRSAQRCRASRGGVHLPVRRVRLEGRNRGRSQQPLMWGRDSAPDTMGGMPASYDLHSDPTPRKTELPREPQPLSRVDSSTRPKHTALEFYGADGGLQSLSFEEVYQRVAAWLLS